MSKTKNVTIDKDLAKKIITYLNELNLIYKIESNHNAIEGLNGCKSKLNEAITKND